MPRPGRNEQDQAEESECDRGRLSRAYPLMQDRPGNQQRPERHREHEHGRASCAASGDRHRGCAEIHHRLEEAGEDHRLQFCGQQTTATREQRGEEHEHGEPRAMRIELEWIGVCERGFHDDPVAAPDKRQEQQRNVRRATRVDAEQRHVSRRGTARCGERQRRADRGAACGRRRRS